MTYPPNLLRLDPEFRVLLPEGATGGSGELEYQGPYRVAAILAGALSGVKVIIPDPVGASRLGRVVPLIGSGDVYLLGARPGDPEPPYVTLRVYPEFPQIAGVIDRGEPLTVSGRPHEFPPGSGLWDLSDIGGENRPTVASPEQFRTLEQVLADYGLILPNLANATAQLREVVAEVQAELDRNRFDVDAALAQMSAARQSLGPLRDQVSYLLGLDNLSAILAQLAVVTGLQFDREGWTLGVNGVTRTLRVRLGGSPLELIPNQDGSVTIRGDPDVFGVRVNADQSQTLYRRTAQ